jgi:hypothetical protein
VLSRRGNCRQSKRHHRRRRVDPLRFDTQERPRRPLRTMHPFSTFYPSSRRYPPARCPAVGCVPRLAPAANCWCFTSRFGLCRYFINSTAPGRPRPRWPQDANERDEARCQLRSCADSGTQLAAGLCSRRDRRSGMSFSVRRRRVSRLRTVARQIWVIRRTATICPDFWSTALDLRGLKGKDRTATGTVANLSQGKNSRFVSAHRPTAFAAIPALLGSRPVTSPRVATRRAMPWDCRLE